MEGLFTSLAIAVACFLVLLPVMLILSEMWSMASPIIYSYNVNATNSTTANKISNFGNSFFYYSGDTIIVLMYFFMILGLFLSALYEGARPETLPIGLLFLIPLILITMPLADLSHAFYTNPGFANVAQYYTSSEYLSDYAPYLTALCTIIYLYLVMTRKNIISGLGFGGGGGNVIGG